MEEEFNIDEVEVLNENIVAAAGTLINVLNPLRSMTKIEALVHAAWLVALADESENNEHFKLILEKVKNT